MSTQRVSMFISHKVASHRRAAERVKTLLESRAERLDVHICEDIPANTLWRQWIADRIAQSQLCLVVLPPATLDLTWIINEIGRFQGACPNGRLLVCTPPSQPVPDPVRENQAIEIAPDVIHTRLLRPLYRDTTLTGLDTPLNPRLPDTELARDAVEIADLLLGRAATRVERFGASLLVDTSELPDITPTSLANAHVQAPNGCADILNWTRHTFLWSALRTRAAEDTGKGTFWVSEMEDIMTEVARGEQPRVMTSTFRGRGHDVAGRIFRPQLDRVEFRDERPVRYHFVFYEVLVPELVRGPAHIGDVFNLLYIATRVRWEVLYPFLVKAVAAQGTPPARWEMRPEEQRALIARVSQSLRIIEHEAERHDMFGAAVEAFDAVGDRNLILELLRKRTWIRTAINAAAERNDFAQFMAELMQGLTGNGEAMEFLATRFLDLVRADREHVQRLLHSLPLDEAP